MFGRATVGSVQPTRLVSGWAMEWVGTYLVEGRRWGCASADVICRASFWVAVAALRSFRDDGCTCKARWSDFLEVEVEVEGKWKLPRLSVCPHRGEVSVSAWQR